MTSPDATTEPADAPADLPEADPAPGEDRPADAEARAADAEAPRRPRRRSRSSRSTAGPAHAGRGAAVDGSTDAADAAGAADAADAGDAADGARQPRGRGRWLAAAVVVSLLFAAAMVVLWQVRRPADIPGITPTQQAAVDAASQEAVNLQTFRRASFDQDFANALAGLTSDFGKSQLLPKKDALQQQLTAGKRDATAKALSAGLVSSTPTSAVVLVVTNTTQTGDDGTSTPFVFSRLQLTLQLVGGKWLVSDLKSVGLS